jgi:hypothetical protein
MTPSDPQGELLPTEPTPAGSSEPEPEDSEAVVDLGQQLFTLKTMLVMTLVALLVLSAAVNLFLYKQMRMTRAVLNDLRPKVGQVYSEFRKVREPAVKNFIGALQTFSSTNRSFQPILEKYRPYLSAYFTGPAAPAPLPPVVQPLSQPVK